MGADASAQELLEVARGAARRTRRARQGYWLPLLVFGAVIVGAAPFYITQPVVVSSTGTGTVVSLGVYHPASPFDVFAGYSPVRAGHGSAIYWPLALLVAYGAVLIFSRLRARRVGVGGRIWPYIAAGVGVAAVFLLTAPSVPHAINLGRIMPMEVLFRGFAPLLLIGLGLVVLAWIERSVMLSCVVVCYLAAAVVSSLYDLENVFFRLGWLGMGSFEYVNLPNLLLPAVVLLLGAGISALWTRRAV